MASNYYHLRHVPQRLRRRDKHKPDYRYILTLWKSVPEDFRPDGGFSELSEPGLSSLD